jgi:hypothetical protein
LIEQHLQWTQFWALMTKFLFPSASGSEYSYTPAGQNLCSGPAYSCKDIATVTEKRSEI